MTTRYAAMMMMTALLSLGVSACDNASVPEQLEPISHAPIIRPPMAPTRVSYVSQIPIRTAAEEGAPHDSEAPLLPPVSTETSQAIIDTVSNLAVVSDGGPRKTHKGVSELIVTPISVTLPDDCRDTGCDNGGRCAVNEARALCVCARGFTGARCEIDITVEHSAVDPNGENHPAHPENDCDHEGCHGWPNVI